MAETNVESTTRITTDVSEQIYYAIGVAAGFKRESKREFGKRSMYLSAMRTIIAADALAGTKKRYEVETGKQWDDSLYAEEVAALLPLGAAVADKGDEAEDKDPLIEKIMGRS